MLVERGEIEKLLGEKLMNFRRALHSAVRESRKRPEKA